MANAPRSGQDGGDKQMICVGGEAECFSAQGWTGQITLDFLEKLPPSRNVIEPLMRRKNLISPSVLSYASNLLGPNPLYAPPGKEHPMAGVAGIKEHMEVIGADGVHVGTVDKVEGQRIKLTKKDSGEGSHKGHHHYIDGGLVAEIEGDKVRLSANADVAVTMEQEK
jgi:hypothetical protein